MMEIIVSLVNAIILGIVTLWMWTKFYNQKINFKDYKNYIFIILSFLLVAVGYFHIQTYLRSLYTFFVLFTINYSIFHRKINETIITTFLTQFIPLVAEMIVAFFITTVLKIDIRNISFNGCEYILLNASVAVVTIILSHIKFVQRITNALFKFTNKLQRYYIGILIIIFLLSTNLLLEFFYNQGNTSTLLIINSTMIILYLMIIFKASQDKYKTLQLQVEYDALLNNLNEYEKMLEFQRMTNHENKNQLAVIKGLVSKNNKKLNDYVNTLIKDIRNDDEQLLKLTNAIPTGGLQGLVYYKSLLMKEKGICLQLEIEKKLNKKIDNIMSTKENQELCKIVGVYLDNAIHAAGETKEKLICVEMYTLDDDFVVSISNTYQGNINMEKLQAGKYTTKGEGHGYGLKLVNAIVEKNFNLEKCTNIIGNVFQQQIKLKLQK